jgi:hypothetical protein
MMAAYSPHQILSLTMKQCADHFFFFWTAYILNKIGIQMLSPKEKFHPSFPFDITANFHSYNKSNPRSNVTINQDTIDDYPIIRVSP